MLLPADNWERVLAREVLGRAGRLPNWTASNRVAGSGHGRSGRGNPARAGWDNGETAEIRALRGRVALASYVGAALEGRAVEGAEREFDTALSHPCPGMPS